jgi:hypothetical protein
MPRDTDACVAKHVRSPYNDDDPGHAALSRTDVLLHRIQGARCTEWRRARRIRPGGPILTATIKTTALFLQPFKLAGFNETLPAGEYRIETELLEPLAQIEPGIWTSSVLIHLHPRASHPGLSRTLTVPLAELERAVAKDKLTGKALTDYVFEQLLADPMTSLVMQADGVSEDELRSLYSGSAPEHATDGEQEKGALGGTRKFQSREGMTPRPGSSRPGIGE